MKINSLYIHAFGGLKNFTLNLSDGLTVIYGENEMGKSTVMAFIKMMFYGSGRAGGQLSKNLRQKYTPWDAGQMAGSIDFEHNGKSYRLEKEFRSSNSTDKATLCDLGLGTRQAVSGDIGASFFGLSLSAFERSVFIGQLGFPEKDATAEGELNSKLSNLTSTGEEGISFEAVNKRLEKAKLSLMSKSGRAGEYDKNLKLLAETEAKIEKTEALTTAVNDKKTYIKTLENEALRLSQKVAELKQKISSEQDVRNAEKLKALLELKKQLDEFNETLKLNDGSIIDEMYLRKLKFLISRVEAINEKITSKANEIELLNKSIEAGINPPEDATKENAEELQAKIADQELIKEKNTEKLNNAATVLVSLEAKLAEAENVKKKFNPVFVFGGGALLLVAVVTLILNLIIPSAVIAVFGLIGLILGLILKPYDHSVKMSLEQKISAQKTLLADLKIKDSEIKAELSSLTSKLEAIRTALSSSAAVIEKQRQLLSDCKAESDALKAEKETELLSLTELFSKYRAGTDFDTIINSLEEITQKTEKQKEIKQQLSFILKDLNGISYEEASQKLTAINKNEIDLSENFDELKAEYDAAVERISELKSLIATNLAEVKSALTGAQDTELLKKQLEDLRIKTASQKEFCDALDIAASALADSFAEVRRSYGSVLEKKAGKIFEGLTGGKWEGMNISKSLDINVNERGNFGSREIDYLSSGTADQAYLSLRLALAELICRENEALPLFLDDALTQYDDRRQKSALKFLKDYAENTQAVLFTCHSNICETAKELNAAVIKLGQ